MTTILPERVPGWVRVGDPRRLLGLHPDASGVRSRMNSESVASRLIPDYMYSYSLIGFRKQSRSRESENKLTTGSEYGLYGSSGIAVIPELDLRFSWNSAVIILMLRQSGATFIDLHFWFSLASIVARRLACSRPDEWPS